MVISLCLLNVLQDFHDSGEATCDLGKLGSHVVTDYLVYSADRGFRGLATPRFQL